MAPLLVIGRDVVTMNARREIIRDGAVLVENGRITAVGKATDLRGAHPGVAELGDAHAVITPGFVNAHQHLTGDRLVRSAIPDNIAAHDAIFGWAVPVHVAHTEADDELSAVASCVEQAGNGFTTVIEAGTVAHPLAVARGIETVGLRGRVGRWGWDIDDAPYAAPCEQVIEQQRANVEALAGFERVAGWVTLVGHDLMSDELAAGASQLARELGTGLTFHISPHTADVDSYITRTGRRPLVHLDHLGVLGRHVLLAHAVHLDDAEADAVLRTGTAIAYTPWAYLRLGPGVGAAGRHAELARRGARIALGADAENAGDALDGLRVAALCAGLAKDQASDPTQFGAHDAFELLTIRGAEAVGMAAEIGSLEVGKWADIVVFDTSGSEWTARSEDVILQLVWASDGRAVRDVVVGGDVIVRRGRSTRVDRDDLRREVASARTALLGRAGLAPASRWPVV